MHLAALVNDERKIIRKQGMETSGSRESYNRVKPPTNIAAGSHSTIGFVVVQIAGGVNELVADIVVSPAEAIPQLWIIVEKPTTGEGWD